MPLFWNGTAVEEGRRLVRVCWWVSVVASREEKAEARGSDCEWWRKRQCVVDFDGEKESGMAGYGGKKGWLER